MRPLWVMTPHGESSVTVGQVPESAAYATHAVHQASAAQWSPRTFQLSGSEQRVPPV